MTVKKYVFTEADLVVLKRYHVYFKQLSQSGAVRVSVIIVDELQKVYESTSGRKMNRGCSACVVDAVKTLFRNYEEYLKNVEEDNKTAGSSGPDIQRSQSEGPEPTVEQSTLPGIESSGIRVRQPGKNGRKNK